MLGDVGKAEDAERSAGIVDDDDARFVVLSHELLHRLDVIGATAGDLLRLVLRQAGGLIAAGLGLGLIGSAIFTRLMTGLLYGVSALDPLTFVAVSVLLAAVALLASYVPARRATRVDPVTALRYE